MILSCGSTRLQFMVETDSLLLWRAEKPVWLHDDLFIIGKWIIRRLFLDYGISMTENQRHYDNMFICGIYQLFPDFKLKLSMKSCRNMH